MYNKLSLVANRLKIDTLYNVILNSKEKQALKCCTGFSEIRDRLI